MTHQFLDDVPPRSFLRLHVKPDVKVAKQPVRTYQAASFRSDLLYTTVAAAINVGLWGAILAAAWWIFS